MDPLGHDEILSPFSNMKYVETEDGDEIGPLEGVDVGVLDGCNVGGETTTVGEIEFVIGPRSPWFDLQIICVYAFAPQPVVIVL